MKLITSESLLHFFLVVIILVIFATLITSVNFIPILVDGGFRWFLIGYLLSFLLTK